MNHKIEFLVGAPLSLELRQLVLDPRGDAPIAIRPAAPVEAKDFVPVPLPSSPTESAIQIELRSGAKRLSLRWPASQARECSVLLQALMK